ncbi:MAG: DUF362 domain-containing protein [Acetivibrionales bacterium]
MDRNSIYVVYGSSPKEMVLKILAKADIEGQWDKAAHIGIKPNLVVSKPHTSGATTSPHIVSAVIEYLILEGYKNITILEGSWVGDNTSRAFYTCGYEEISRKYGVPLVDLKKDGYFTCDVKGMNINICNKIRDVDYLINIPVLKGHCQTKITCALKNMKGCIPDIEKRRFHTMGLHKPIAYLNLAVKSDLIIVDGMMGDLDFEEGGNPVEMNRILMGRDAVLIDTYAAELMGFGIEEIPYIRMAEQIGVGCADLDRAHIIELNKDSRAKRINRTRKVERLSEYILERDACSACYGSLIHALERLYERGLLGSIKGKIHIGQAFKGKRGCGIGVGACAAQFDKSVPGCPPSAKKIVEHLERWI